MKGEEFHGRVVSAGVYLFPLTAAILLVVLESDVLYALQEYNLFLHTQLFLEQQMVKPGGLLTWIGCYLTQYFYYPMLGAGILCLLWAFFMWLCKRAFRLQDTWLTLIPAACLVLTITTLGYWIYFLKLPGHAFCATIGSIVTLTLVWGYRAIPHRYHLSSTYIIFVTGLGYLFFGFYALMASALMAIIEWREGKSLLNDGIVAISQIVLWPLIGYYFYFHETNFVNIYWAALPVFAHQEERCFAYNIPYIILFGSMALMAVKPNIKSAKWLDGAILLVTTTCLFLFWNRDDNFHRELSMSRLMEQQNWPKLLQTAKEAKGEPTRAMWMMQNLALFRMGRQGEEMYTYPIGSQRPDAPFNIHLIHTVGRMLYLQYGLSNYCYRWCMEDGVEYGWSVEKLKLMTKSALVNNELATASKYLSLLRKTDFHKGWAKRYSQYLQHPNRMADDPELRLLLHLNKTENFLTNDQSLAEMFLLEHFSTINSREPLLQEAAMAAALQTKAPRLFWMQFNRYAEQHQGMRLPRHYQEAVCLFGHLDNIDLRRMPLDPIVLSNYEELAVTMNDLHQRGITIAEMRPHIPAHLHATYYYDYYFNTYNYLEE